MTSRAVLAGLLACTIFIASSGRVLAEPAEAGKDSRLEAARRHVEQTDRYLHHSHLARGMKGYGLTVLAGTEIVRFDVEILSVLTKWDLHQDVILARLSGQNLEKTGVIMGMSGSPVYVRHDGKDKLIGAVAYRFFAQTEPLCGIQPITQMLVLDAPDAEGRQPQPDAADAPPPAAHPAPAGYLARALAAGKLDLPQLGWPARPARGDGEPPAGPRLVPLTTPLMISGIGSRRMAKVCETFAPAGLLPVQAGGVSAAVEKAAAAAKLEPGAAISIPLVTGDADWAAVGTTTEVIGDYVLALGHEFYGEGPVEMPMGPAYVHTVIPSVYSSFKLGSTLKVTGALMQDEYTGVGGRIGKKARMIPMSLTVRWPRSEQKFQYQLLRHRWLTAALGSLMVADSVYVGRDLPDQHTIDYTVKVEFEKLGTYRAENRSSQHDSLDVRSDVSRPLAALMNTPLGRPVFPKRIDVTVVIRTSQETAAIQALKLDRNVYRPGDTVKGKVTLRPFRTERTTTEISIQLPKDLPDGNYELTACDGEAAAVSLRQEMPHRFTPRTVPELFAVLQELVRPRRNCLFVRLPLPEGGLAVGTNELEHLPSSLTGILTKAAPIDAKPYRRAKVVEFPSRYVLSGSAKAGFRVEKEPARQH